LYHKIEQWLCHKGVGQWVGLCHKGIGQCMAQGGVAVGGVVL
jgi:hypothetical protein